MPQHTKGDPQLMRSMNRRLVIDALRRSGPMSRTGLCHAIGVEPSTITSIMQGLLREGLVQEVGVGVSTGGRRPIMIDLNYGYGHTLGAKIEVQRVLVGLVTLDGHLVAQTQERYPRGSSPEVVLTALKKAVVCLPQVPRLLGIGVGISGFVHSNSDHLMYSPILGWEHQDLGSRLRQDFSYPVFLSNDVNALTLGEKWHGVGKGYNNFVCVTVGEGIGAGVYLEGRLYEGAHGGAGELGHTCIDMNGPLCHCGETGCLEALASDSFLLTEARRCGLPCNADVLVQQASMGNPQALDIFAKMGRHLGIGLKNLVNLLNPEALVIGGERLNALAFFKPAMEEQLLRHSFSSYDESFAIVAAELGDAGWLIGAATLPLRAKFSRSEMAS